MERVATWECLAGCDVQVLGPGRHYPSKDQAREGLRYHLLTEHAALVWETQGTVVLGRVIRFHPVQVA